MDREIPSCTEPSVKPVRPVDEQRHPVKRSLPWMAACLVTISLHGGLFWYFTHEVPHAATMPAEAPAAVMVDMAPEVQQAFSQNDAALGKPMEEAAETPPPPPPPDTTTPVEDSPSEAVAPMTPTPPARPKVEQAEKRPPPEKPVKKMPSVKLAAKTASAPRSDQHAKTTTASSAGAATSPAMANWFNQVRAAIQRNIRPTSGSGRAVARFSVSDSGFITGVAIVTSAGSPEMDRSVLDAIRRTTAPPPPPGAQKTMTQGFLIRAR